MWNNLGGISLPGCAQPQVSWTCKNSTLDNSLAFLRRSERHSRRHRGGWYGCWAARGGAALRTRGACVWKDSPPATQCFSSSCQETLQWRIFSKHPPCWGHLAGSQDRDWAEFGLAQCWQQVSKAEKCRWGLGWTFLHRGQGNSGRTRQTHLRTDRVQLRRAQRCKPAFC